MAEGRRALMVALAVRGETPRRTETGEAPGWQGARSEHIRPYVSDEQHSQTGCIVGRMQRGFCHGLLVALLLAAGPAAGQSVERSLAVTVLDGDGSPVPDLGPTDFVVREDGARREVLRVARDTAPLQIALLVDTSQAAASAVVDLRKGLAAFIAAMDDGDSMAIIGFGGPPRILAASTRERAPLLETADRIFATAGNAAYLLDAMSETATGFIKREVDRPVMVVLATEGLDHSYEDVTTLLRTLEDATITVHTVVLTGRRFSSRSSPFPGRFDPLRQSGSRGALDGPFAQWRIDRDMVLQRGPLLTGGRRRDLVASSGMEHTMREVAAELKNRYLVVYAAPRTLVPPERVDVQVARDGLSVRGAPTGIGDD